MDAYEAADFIEECQLEDAVGELSPRQIADLDQILPGWRDVNAEAMRTEAWLEELNVGYASAEESAGAWLQRQQEYARTGALPADKRAQLDKALPGWLMA